MKKPTLHIFLILCSIAINTLIASEKAKITSSFSKIKVVDTLFFCPETVAFVNLKKYFRSKDDVGVNFVWVNSDTSIGLCSVGTSSGTFSFMTQNACEYSEGSILEIIPIINAKKGKAKYIYIKIYPLQKIEISYAIVKNKVNLFLVSSENIRKCVWLPKWGLNESTSFNPSANLDKSIGNTYYVVVTDEHGCLNNACTTVKN